MKSVYRFIGDKRKTLESVGPLQKEMGDLITQAMSKARYSITFLPWPSLARVPATPLESEQAKAGTGTVKNCPV